MDSPSLSRTAPVTQYLSFDVGVYLVRETYTDRKGQVVEQVSSVQEQSNETFTKLMLGVNSQ
jgi:hypothetical protein